MVEESLPVSPAGFWSPLIPSVFITASLAPAAALFTCSVACVKKDQEKLCSGHK
jgi:hypothetical protein